MKIACALVLILMLSVAYGQSVDTLWTRSLGDFQVQDICVSQDLIFLGGHDDEALQLSVYDLDGNMQFSFHSDNGLGSAISDMERPDDLYVVGRIEHDSEPDEMLLSRFGTGGIMGRYDLSEYGAYRGDQLKSNAAGELFATGKTISDTIHSILIKIDIERQIVWSYSSIDQFSWPSGDIAPTADGGCLMCDNWDGVRLRKVSFDGQLEWDTTYAQLPRSYGPIFIASLSDGNFVAACTEFDELVVNMFVKFSPLGNVLYMRFLELDHAFDQGTLSTTDDRILSTTTWGDNERPLVVLNNELDTLWTFSPMQVGFPYGDIIEAAFVNANEIVLSYRDLDTESHLICIRHESEAVHDEPESVPHVASLCAYPNPFNATTTLAVYVKAAAKIRLSLVDMLGRNVEDFSSDQVEAGEFHYTFDGANLPSGSYFARVQLGELTQVVKVVLLK